jgi:hypothetical protein
MFGADITVTCALGLLVRETEDAPCPLRKSFHASHKYVSPENRQELPDAATQ